MAYCRFSSDNWKSDVYVYEGCDNAWHIHVAGRRRLNLDTLPPNPWDIITSNDNAQWLDMYHKHHAALEALPIEDIDLPYAGDSLSHSSPGDCAIGLKMLKDLGYHIPDWVIPDLEEEQKELDDLEGKCNALWRLSGGQTEKWNGVGCDCEIIEGNYNCKLNRN